MWGSGAKVGQRRRAEAGKYPTFARGRVGMESSLPRAQMWAIVANVGHRRKGGAASAGRSWEVPHICARESWDGVITAASANVGHRRKCGASAQRWGSGGG